MDRAVRSGAIVSSLFPEQVQDRLYEKEDPDKTKKRKDIENWFRKSLKDEEDSSQPMMTMTMERNDTTGEGTTRTSDATTSRNSITTASSSSRPRTRPIADVFPDTTVMFADLAGFTSWSSKRSPEDVFELLETLYAAFDAAATKRKVFKVETIGDCYLAVAGLPHPQPDHSVLVVKFARDCMVQMQSLVQNQLAERLGTDTSYLQLRVGLHTGSVTAGVLRGQKSRFQLFGDTVNTAARMESTGKPGWIQASQTTVDALIYQGKQRWVKPREDMVLAKGKGTLVTYWVTIPARKGEDSGTEGTTVANSEGSSSSTRRRRRSSSSQPTPRGTNSDAK